MDGEASLEAVTRVISTVKEGDYFHQILSTFPAIANLSINNNARGHPVKHHIITRGCSLNTM